MTSLVYVLSWERSPLALKNKPAVPVGYHTPCRSAERELNVSGIFPQYVRATTNTGFNRQQRQKTEPGSTKKNEHTDPNRYTHRRCA